MNRRSLSLGARQPRDTRNDSSIGWLKVPPLADKRMAEIPNVYRRVKRGTRARLHAVRRVLLVRPRANGNGQPFIPSPYGVERTFLGRGL